MTAGPLRTVAPLLVLCACSGGLPDTAHLKEWRGVADGKRMIVALIINSQCTAATDPAFKVAFRSLVDSLSAIARDDSLALEIVGISTDVEVATGIRVLAGLGPFHEVIVGRSWLNSGVERLIWEDIPGVPAIPQVVVTEREISVWPAWIEFSPQVLRARFLGEREVVAALHNLDMLRSLNQSDREIR